MPFHTVAIMIFIGIDSGTQSTKAIALDLDSGDIVADAQEKYDLIDGLPPGHLEQHPQSWIDAVQATVGACIETLAGRTLLSLGPEIHLTAIAAQIAALAGPRMSEE